MFIIFSFSVFAGIDKLSEKPNTKEKYQTNSSKAQVTKSTKLKLSKFKASAPFLLQKKTYEQKLSYKIKNIIKPSIQKKNTLSSELYSSRKKKDKLINSFNNRKNKKTIIQPRKKKKVSMKKY